MLQSALASQLARATGNLSKETKEASFLFEAKDADHLDVQTIFSLAQRFTKISKKRKSLRMLN